MDVFVDTTVLWSGTALNERSMRELDEMRAAGKIRVRVPEVVVLELTRHATEVEKRYRKEEERMNSCLRSVGALQAPVVEGTVRRWGALIRRRISEAATIEALPAVTHAELVARDLGGRRPFQSSGKGYRDALIWETLVEGVDETPVVLLTANKNDFGSGKPHVDLASDLDGATQVVVLEDPAALRRWLEDPSAERRSPMMAGQVDAPVSLGAIEAAINGWPTVTAREVRFGRRLTEDAEIEGLSVDRIRDVVEFAPDDGFGGFEAELEVEADVTAEIPRSQLGVLDPDVRILEVEPGQEFVSVSATRRLVLNVVVTYRLDTMDVDEARVEDARYS